MRVQKISIRNVMGIEALDFEPGRITVIEGGNGAGKSSVLEAIKAALGGGKDATLLRKGTQKGEVVLLLDDGSTITKPVSELGRDDVAFSDARGVERPRPQTALSRLVNDESLNPVSFLMAKPKERVERLLKALPVRLTPEMVRSIYPGSELLKPESRIYGLHAFDAIAALRKDDYDARTGVNRTAKEMRAMIADLERSLPANVPEAPEAELAAVQAALSEIKRERSRRREEVDAWHFREIERIRREADERKEAIDDELGPKAQKLTEREAELVEASKHVERVATARETIRARSERAAQLEEESRELSARIEKLDELKASIAAQQKLKGVEVVDGDLLVDGIPFDRVNTARRVQVAVQLAELSAGELGLVVVDGLECLEAEMFEAFVQYAAKRKVQFVVTRVTEGPLRVSTVTPEQGVLAV